MLYLCIISPEFLEAIRSVKPEPPMRWKALVVDEHSQRILYNVLKRNDILEENISSTLSWLLFFFIHLKESSLIAIYAVTLACLYLLPYCCWVTTIFGDFSDLCKLGQTV